MLARRRRPGGFPVGVSSVKAGGWCRCEQVAMDDLPLPVFVCGRVPGVVRATVTAALALRPSSVSVCRRDAPLPGELSFSGEGSSDDMASERDEGADVPSRCSSFFFLGGAFTFFHITPPVLPSSRPQSVVFCFFFFLAFRGAAGRKGHCLGVDIQLL